MSDQLPAQLSVLIGIPQGYVVSPLLVLIFISYLLFLSLRLCYMFADDMKSICATNKVKFLLADIPLDLGLAHVTLRC